uniref:Anti-lipopolysaccharide factor isoform 7 n=1 Tax=Portunus trituberculatus TaxID=210409 RepID=H9MZ07_PORTR|nr:anti-lipopolysaccharide factor isoform 7 [Portunus trituberculatus]
MRKGVVTGLFVALVVMCLYLPQPCEAQYEALTAAILTKLSKMWHSDTLNFLGHTCHVSRTPTVKRFKLYWKGKFWCPGWAPFSGTSRTKSRSGSARGATKSFVGQALQRRLIAQQEADLWLKG